MFMTIRKAFDLTDRALNNSIHYSIRKNNNLFKDNKKNQNMKANVLIQTKL